MSILPKPSRLLQLQKLQCSIFQTSFNPTGVRTGAKYLKKHLKGPLMQSYYPSKPNLQPDLDWKALNEQFPQLNLINVREDQRQIDVARRRRRGKGAPKKKDKAAAEADKNSKNKKRK